MWLSQEVERVHKGYFWPVLCFVLIVAFLAGVLLGSITPSKEYTVNAYAKSYTEGAWAKAETVFQQQKRDGWGFGNAKVESYGCRAKELTTTVLHCKFFYSNLTSIDVGCTPSGCSVELYNSNEGISWARESLWKAKEVTKQ